MFVGRGSSAKQKVRTVVNTASKGACHPRFAELISEFGERLTDSGAICAYGLWPDFTISYISPGWFGFAAVNGGEPDISSRWNLGSDLLSGINGPLRNFYRRCFQRSLDEQRPWEHCYECSSAERFRWFHMVAYPLALAAGLLVVHSLRLDRLHHQNRVTPATNPDLYYDHDGILHQCSYCRKTRRNDRPEVWDWVRDWVSKSPPDTSHGICESCSGFYAARMKNDLSLPRPFSTISSIG